MALHGALWRRCQGGEAISIWNGAREMQGKVGVGSCSVKDSPRVMASVERRRATSDRVGPSQHLEGKAAGGKADGSAPWGEKHERLQW